MSLTRANGALVIDLNNTAQLNLNAGALSIADSNINSITMDSGAVLNISNGDHNLYGRIAYAGSGTVRVTGSQATIDMRQALAFSGTFEYFFDANGISPLNYYSYASVSTAKLNINLSGYNGVSDNFIFMKTGDIGNSSPFAGGNISVSGLQAGASYTISQLDGNGDFTLNYYAPVPEPFALGLLLVGGAVLAARRRGIIRR